MRFAFLEIMCVCLAILCLPFTAFAACADQPITFINKVDLDFDETAGIAGTGYITLASNGNITYGAGYTGGGLGIGGFMNVDGSKNCNVSVSCAATATLSDGAGNTINLVNIYVRDRDGSYGGGSQCQGIGTDVITGMKLKNNANQNSLYFSGQIDGTSGIPPGGAGSYQFGTANSGGTALAIQVTYDNP